MHISFNPFPNSIKPIKPHLTGAVFGDELDKGVLFTFSGKSALAILLQYYRSIGRLKDKSEQVLVPEWIGYWVYMAMHKHCFPTTVFNKKVKGILVYHQWGFPQDMKAIRDFCRDKKLFVIEDCAHAAYSHFRDQRLGTFGDGSIFSLAKFFPSVLGGAIYTKDKNLKKFVAKKLRGRNEKLSKQVFRRRFLCEKNPTPANNIELERNYAVYDQLSACPMQSLDMVRKNIKDGALEKRRRNYELFRSAFARYDKYSLYAGDILPWAVPLFLKPSHARRVVKKLQAIGVETGLYHFDIRRNMLKPDYQICIGLPCHQGISENTVLKIIDIVAKNV